jgi:hypothetical protein
MNVALSAHDKRLDIELEEKSDERVTLCWRDSNDQPHKLTDPHLPEDGYCWVDFIEPLKSSGSKPLTFGVREAAANSIAMTRWELSERNRYRTGSVDPEYESVGFYISYPVEKLHLRLDFPDELDGITPEVRCHRHRDSPNFPLTFRPSQRQGARGDERFLLDTDLIEEEKKRLRYDSARSSWSLEVDRPIVGNIYALRWPVPNLLADQPIIDRTSAYQKLLLRLLAAGPGLPGPSVPTRQACQRLFVELAKLLMTRFRSDVIPDETQTAFLMVYDAKDLLLRPVLTYQSSGTLPKGSYEVPLGGGVAGAAFLHRRIVAWKNDPSSKSMIKPLSSGALDSRRVLALPIFHQQRNTSGNLELDLKPGAVVGVVTLGSDEFTSRISECDIENKTATEIGQEAQELAQKYVFDILSILSRK